MEKVIAYIDGFNLYFGLKSKGWRRYYWLNQQQLVQNLLKPTQNLVLTKYFTAHISGPPDKRKRQTTYIEALSTLSDFQIYYGKYQKGGYPLNASTPYILWFLSTICRYGNGDVLTACSTSITYH